VTNTGPQYFHQTPIFGHFMPEDMGYNDPPPEYTPPDYDTLMDANRFSLEFSISSLLNKKNKFQMKNRDFQDKVLSFFQVLKIRLYLRKFD
jgi:hypothetical protein